jgi:hypothetical protein
MLEIGIARDDLAGDYTDWINRGVRACQRDHSYNCMRHVSNVTMAAGTSSVVLPGDFKELQPKTHRNGPVNVYSVAEGYTAVEILSREALISAAPSPGSVFAQTRMFMSNDGNQAFLNFLDNTSTDVTFSVAYFRFLPPLSADSDENYLTREFEDMVQAKIKQIAFSSINDPQAAAELALYKIEKERAVAFDARQRSQGQNTRMGG